MEKYISKLYLVCIIIGITAVIAGVYIGNTGTYLGYAQDGSVEAISPKEVTYTSDLSRQYSFSALLFTDDMADLYFFSAHTNIKVYVDEKTDSNLIYELSAKPSIIGSTPGACHNIIHIPKGCDIVYVDTEIVYPELSHNKIDFYRSNGVAIYRNLLHSSVAEAFISGTLIILGIIILLYCFYARKRIDVDTSVVYFAFFLVILGSWTFNETSMSVLLFSNRTLCSLIGFLLLFMMQQPIILFTKSYLRVKNEIFGNILCILITVIMILFLILHMTGMMEMRRVVKVIHSLLFIDLGYMVFCFIYHLKYYGFTKRIAINIIGAGILVAAALIDMNAYYSTNRINDVIGRCGILAYSTVLAAEVISELTYQIQESRKTMYYKELAMLDSLTGLQNRNAYELWEKTNKDISNISLITFDLNNLKECNDTKGHIIGDKYIVDAAKMIYDIFGRYGVCYRIGGDEFLVVLKNISGNNVLERYIQKLRKNEMEYNLHAEDICMEIACGYASANACDETLGDIRKRADFSMYDNKTKIKNKQVNKT